MVENFVDIRPLMINSHLKRHLSSAIPHDEPLDFSSLFGIGKSHFDDSLFVRCLVEHVGPPFLVSLHMNCNAHHRIDSLLSCHIFLAAHREGAQWAKAESHP